VPDRAVEAGARLVSERGPATVTLEAVAEAASRCVHSRYSIFGTRDELLAASYEWYSPLDDLVRLSRDSADFEQTVASLYLTMAVCLTRGPAWRRRCWHMCSAIRTAQRRGSSHPPIRAVALPARYSDTTSACMSDHPLNDAKAG
jgi:AcrR family transcriptional regulator